jgi:hypothetical protein
MNPCRENEMNFQHSSNPLEPFETKEKCRKIYITTLKRSTRHGKT